MIPQSVLQGIAQAVNSALATDPATLNKLAGLTDKVYAIDCILPPLHVKFRFHQGGIELVGDEYPAHVTLRGTAMALVRLLESAANDSGATSQSDVEINGDAGALLQLSRAFAELEIDWEELLSRVVGDVGARAITQGMDQARRFESQYREKGIRAAQDISHQQLGLARPEDIRRLADRSRQLQYRIDRLEARVNIQSQKQTNNDH